MQVLGDVRRHYWLAKKMADLNGVDLNSAFARGDLDQEAWAELIDDCRKCAWVDGCERYLERSRTEGTAEGPLPQTCRNADRYAAIRVEEEKELSHGNQ